MPGSRRGRCDPQHEGAALHGITTEIFPTVLPASLSRWASASWSSAYVAASLGATFPSAAHCTSDGNPLGRKIAHEPVDEADIGRPSREAPTRMAVASPPIRPTSSPARPSGNCGSAAPTNRPSCFSSHGATTVHALSIPTASKIRSKRPPQSGWAPAMSSSGSRWYVRPRLRHTGARIPRSCCCRLRPRSLRPCSAWRSEPPDVRPRRTLL